MSERGCFSYAKNLGDGAKVGGDFVEGITLGGAGTSCSAVGGGFVEGRTLEGASASCSAVGGVGQYNNFADENDYRFGRVQSGSQMGNLEGVEFNKENAVEVNNGYSREFKPTSIDEVREEINKNNYKVDAEEFYYYYSSNGWQAGKSPILDWRAKLKDWDVRKRKVLQDYIDNTKIGSCKKDDKYTNSNERKYEGKDLSALFDNLDDIVF